MEKQIKATDIHKHYIVRATVKMSITFLLYYRQYTINRM